MRLSVLDQSPIPEGRSGVEALHNTLDLAQLADRLGFHRYWVAEHHGGAMVAGAAPEVLIGPIASVTREIRVGSGGVMLPHYSPLKVAEAFSILAGLFPNRIDLAIGRAAGTDPLTTYALQRDRRDASPDDFPDQLTELLAYLNDEMPADHPFARLAGTLPGRPYQPIPWLLGSSAQSAIWAAELGLPYAFADFINPAGAALAAEYRSRFAQAHSDRAPTTIVACWALAAESEEQAQYLASSSRMAMRMLREGKLIPVPTPGRAVRYFDSIGTARDTWNEGRRAVLGTPEQVRHGLLEVAHEYGADEIMVVTIAHDHGARRRSYELIAEAFDLAPRTPAAPGPSAAPAPPVPVAAAAAA